MAPTDIQECCEKQAGIETSSCGGKTQAHKPRQMDFDKEIDEATTNLNTSIQLKIGELYGHLCLEVLELRGHIKSLIRQKEASMRDDYPYAKTSKNRT